MKTYEVVTLRFPRGKLVSSNPIVDVIAKEAERSSDGSLIWFVTVLVEAEDD